MHRCSVVMTKAGDEKEADGVEGDADLTRVACRMGEETQLSAILSADMGDCRSSLFDSDVE